MNSFGRIYRLTSFGESHGPAIGGVIDGLPAGKVFDLHAVDAEMARRRPGGSPNVSARREADRVRFLSGLMACDADGSGLRTFEEDAQYVVSLGTPVGFMVENQDARGGDYEALRHLYRPSHADYAWNQRYGVRDWRGGGRSSGRETLSRVVAGAFARQLLQGEGVEISSRIVRVGAITNPDAEALAAEVASARNDADSVGGIVECRITGLPAGIGEPVFGKLQQMLASAMMSVGGVKGFEYGMGFEGVCARGSERADEFIIAPDGKVATATNHSGGIQGGISNGMDIVMRMAVKPTPTIARELRTVDDCGNPAVVKAAGRHDPSILLRIPVVLEAMAAMTALDAMLLRRCTI